MAHEARLEQTEAGLVASSVGWFVMNARDARWFEKPGQGFSLPLTGATLNAPGVATLRLALSAAAQKRLSALLDRAGNTSTATRTIVLRS